MLHTISKGGLDSPCLQLGSIADPRLIGNGSNMALCPPPMRRSPDSIQGYSCDSHQWQDDQPLESTNPSGCCKRREITRKNHGQQAKPYRKSFLGVLRAGEYRLARIQPERWLIECIEQLCAVEDVDFARVRPGGNDVRGLRHYTDAVDAALMGNLTLLQNRIVVKRIIVLVVYDERPEVSQKNKNRERITQGT